MYGMRKPLRLFKCVIILTGCWNSERRWGSRVGGGVGLRGVGAHGVLGLMGCWGSWGVGIWSGGGGQGCWGSGVLGLMGCWNMEWRWGSGVMGLRGVGAHGVLEYGVEVGLRGDGLGEEGKGGREEVGRGGVRAVDFFSPERPRDSPHILPFLPS